MIYQNIVSVFNSKGCNLLSTQKEKTQTRKNLKLRYIAKCLHVHEVYYNVFKNRDTGILCPKCVIMRNSKTAKENKTVLLQLEKRCIDVFMGLITPNFTCIKAFDGCRADILLKPNNIQTNDWVGIQVKSTTKATRDYGFHLLKKDYYNLLILCICEYDFRM